MTGPIVFLMISLLAAAALTLSSRTPLRQAVPVPIARDRAAHRSSRL